MNVRLHWKSLKEQIRLSTIEDSSVQFFLCQIDGNSIQFNLPLPLQNKSKSKLAKLIKINQDSFTMGTRIKVSVSSVLVNKCEASKQANKWTLNSTKHWHKSQ